ncbi:MAG: hypothetical protein QM813_07150 [Verrucomicrobiota bacterium]
MIDAREDVMTAPASQNRRRPATVSASRGTKPEKAATSKALSIKRVFSDAKVNPFDQIEWDKRTAEITDDGGKVIFKQENVEVPKSWSVLATKVVVSKYFYGEQNTSERETSVRQLIHRITRTIADWGIKDGYFSKADGEIVLQRAHLALRESIRRVQFAGVVQRRPLSRIRHRQKFRPRATGITIAKPTKPNAPAPNTNIRNAARASSSP